MSFFGKGSDFNSYFSLGCSFTKIGVLVSAQTFHRRSFSIKYCKMSVYNNKINASQIMYIKHKDLMRSSFSRLGVAIKISEKCQNLYLLSEGKTAAIKLQKDRAFDVGHNFSE